ncbi:MAG: hypothetical protein HY291_04525 [Planctomycetes bacterium]|nr:hypothetical protein [Planctomycetota bacterium]
MSELRDILQKLANPNPHVRQTNVVERFIPEWVHITGFFENVEITPEVRRIGLDNLVWYAKRRMASMLQDRCERGFHPRHAPWSRRFIGGHRCMRPFTDQENDAERAEFVADIKAGRKPDRTLLPRENLCGPITDDKAGRGAGDEGRGVNARQPNGGEGGEAYSGERKGSASANPGGNAAAVNIENPKAEIENGLAPDFDAAVASLGELDHGASTSETPSDRYAGWEPSQYVAWSIHLSETKLNAFFREATGVSARVVCDVMCARDAAHRVERAAEASLEPILDEILDRVRGKAKLDRADSYAMTLLLSAARRAWNMHRRMRGWCPGERAVALGYKNHARLRDAFIWARLQTPDAIENAVLTRMLCRRLGIKAPAEAAPLPANPANKHFNESSTAPRAIFALVRSPRDQAAATSAPVFSSVPQSPIGPVGPINSPADTPATPPYKENSAEAPSPTVPSAPTMCAIFSGWPEAHAEIGAGI